MSLTETNHGLELTGRSRDALFLSSSVQPDFTHVDIRLNERIRGVFGEDRVNLGSRIRNVCCESIDGLSSAPALSEVHQAHKDIVSTSIRSIFEIQADQMLCQTPVVHLVDLVQHQVEQIETGDERRREINVRWDGQFGIISRVDRIRSGQDGSTSI